MNYACQYNSDGADVTRGQAEVSKSVLGQKSDQILKKLGQIVSVINQKNSFDLNVF